jgi:hypothetical protein
MPWWQTFTFNHISAMSRSSILLVEETIDIPQIIEKHYHIKLYRVHLGIHRVHLGIRNNNFSSSLFITFLIYVLMTLMHCCYMNFCYIFFRLFS